MATSFRRQRRESLRTRLSTWPMKITSFSLNNFAPEEFFGGAKSVSMNGPKFSKSDRTMKAFSFVERNYAIGFNYAILIWLPIAADSVIQITTDPATDHMKFSRVSILSHLEKHSAKLKTQRLQWPTKNDICSKICFDLLSMNEFVFLA